MHARLEELISLRDRQPVDATAALHVAACAQCGAELARLRSVRTALAGLAPLAPPALAWQDIARRLAERPAPAPGQALGRVVPAPRRRLAASRGLATGAVAALALLVVAATLMRPTATQPVAPAAPGTAANASAPALGELMARSQLLEATLRRMPQRPALEVAANSATIDALQSRIQTLDEELASEAAGTGDAEHARELWSSRVQLLDSLVGVRYAEALHAGRPAANPIGEI